MCVQGSVVKVFAVFFLLVSANLHTDVIIVLSILVQSILTIILPYIKFYNVNCRSDPYGAYIQDHVMSVKIKLHKSRHIANIKIRPVPRD